MSYCGVHSLNLRSFRHWLSVSTALVYVLLLSSMGQALWGSTLWGNLYGVLLCGAIHGPFHVNSYSSNSESTGVLQLLQFHEICVMSLSPAFFMAWQRSIHYKNFMIILSMCYDLVCRPLGMELKFSIPQYQMLGMVRLPECIFHILVM